MISDNNEIYISASNNLNGIKSSEILVSVIIPVYNDGENLIKAVDSAINQNGVHVEVIVIDDCSSQNIKMYLDKFEDLKNIIYFKNEINVGVANSRNIGVGLAKGNYIAYLDSDDWWDKDKLSKQLNIFEQTDVDLVCTGRELVLDNGVPTGKIIHVNDVLDYKAILKHNSIACSSVMMRRELALKYPMHHDKYHEDYINWLEITKASYRVCGIDEPLLKYRMSIGGKSRNRIKSAYMTYKTYKVVGVSRLNAAFCTLSHVLNGVIKYR